MRKAIILLTLSLCLLLIAVLSRSATAQPVSIDGFGQTATDPINLPSGPFSIHLTHSGTSNFIVWIFQDSQQIDLLVNTIGNYQGERTIVNTLDPSRPIVFDIDADGAWSIQIDPLQATSAASFSGSGDNVSGLFSPPEPGPWEVSHDGQGNFIVWLHCEGGSDLIQNEIGPVSGSRVVQFLTGPCFWEVQADGAWTLAPPDPVPVPDEEPSIGPPDDSAPPQQEPAVQPEPEAPMPSTVADAGFGPEAVDALGEHTLAVAGLIGAGIAWLIAGLAAIRLVPHYTPNQQRPANRLNSHQPTSLVDVPQFRRRTKRL